jgi:cysteinyl-tRNA synthetase
MRKEELPQARGQEIKVFVCGPTVYDYAHLGHARTYLAVDTMVRYLRFRGYHPYVLMNITDIDERIIKKSNESGRSTQEIAHEFEKSFLEDIKALGVETIDRFERATDHIPDIIKRIEELISTGYAYETETGVYFDVSRSRSYGQLSRQSRADLKLRRLELCSTKHHPEDFSLWRKFDDGPLWDSPWGKGRPGWHIEDTAIAMKYLGSTYDIHAGGVELVFPHHEAEIAQGEALSDKAPFVKHWIHTGMLNVGGVKMSKSLGNVVRIREALVACTAEELRFFFANTHYRRVADFSKNMLVRSNKELQYMRDAVRLLRSCCSENAAGKSDLWLLKSLSRVEAQFRAAMDDDLDTARALKVLSRFLRSTRSEIRSRKSFASGTCETAVKRILALSGIIGVLAA